MSDAPLTTSLALERIEVNLFRGTTPPDRRERIYGGQVIAQSLMAAYRTIENDRVCHSLHAYFLRPGDPTIPIVFQVDRSRDGGSFTTRRVVAIQHGAQIFNFAASFQTPEAGYEHQTPPPTGLSHWRDLPDEAAQRALEIAAAPEAASGPLSRWVPIEIRRPDVSSDLTPSPPESHIWFRAKEDLGADQAAHQAILAYASDLVLVPTALRPHPARWHTKALQSASLDHAMWFHRPLNFNNWHLYTHESPTATGGRGFIRGAVYDEAGVLVASVAQEGLIRMRARRDAG